MATEIYDLSNNQATGISIYSGTDDGVNVRHVFFVMEKNDQAQMILAADSAQDAERWVYTLREILKASRAKDHMRTMPTDEKVLNRLFVMVLKSLALPDAKQGEMLANFSAKQKWQLNDETCKVKCIMATHRGGTRLVFIVLMVFTLLFDDLCWKNKLMVCVPVL